MEGIAQAENEKRELKSKFLINSISVAVPIAVVAMLAFPNKLALGDWTKSLAHVIGAINTITTIVLIAGWIFIKRGNTLMHRLSMLSAFALGGLFLICYVAYHVSNPANKFQGEGSGVRYVYFFFLITHILLSIVVLPFVLRALYYGLTGQYALHRRISRYAFPIWLYVSASGVIVYLLLYHLFPAK